MGYSLGEAIKAARKSRHITQKQLSEMLNMEESSISKIERGYSRPSLDTFRAIAVALDVSSDTLLGMPNPGAGLTEGFAALTLKKITAVQEALEDLSGCIRLLTAKSRMNESGQENGGKNGNKDENSGL
jgi:transcriptional regulator with XRE-family HTH domain